MRFALSHQPTVYQEFGCYGFESYDSYEGFEGSDGFERLSGMYFGRLCAIVAWKGFGAPTLMYFGGSGGLLGTFLAGLGGLWGTILEELGGWKAMLDRSSSKMWVVPNSLVALGPEIGRKWGRNGLKTWPKSGQDGPT